jgi:uncharacterized protein (DUF885 family)
MPEASHPRLQSLAERYWQFLRHEFPLTALLAGQPNEDPTMFREAPADFARRAEQAGAMLAELAGVPRDGLSRQDGITHRLLERELNDLREVHATGSHLRPWLLPAGPEFNTIYFANVSQVGNAQDARAYVARLGTLPTYFDDVRACLLGGAEAGMHQPRVVLSAAAANLRAAAAGAAEQSPWFGPCRRSLAATQEGVASEARRACALIEARIQPALLALADCIERELVPRARDTVACTEGPLGGAFYAFWARHFTTCADLEPEAVHQQGLAQVARLEQEMATVAAQAGFAGDVAGYRRHLRDEPGFHAASAEELLWRVQALAKRIDGKIPGIIGHLPRATYTVQSIPRAAAEKLPLAYAQPNPADGSAAGTFWVSSLPERVPSYLHVSLALHEAWPGHLMHIALMQEMDTLPMFRRANFSKYSACLEGWAMYCEGLGHELGLYDTPHQHFGRLDMEMWRACRLVVDTGIHLHGWGREQAVDYMARRLTLSREAIEAEVDRYVAMPAQALGYMLGGLKFRELRQRAQQRLGERFDVRAYHDQLMAAGAVTLPVLDELVDDWLEQHAA